HLSGIKGGRLVMAMENGTTLVSLILSDVVTDNIETIASGPTAPDRTTFNDAKLILQKYKLWNNERVISKSIRKVIDDGVQKRIADTPKPSDPVFRNVHNILIGNNSIACAAISTFFNNHGIKAMNLGSSFTGCPSNLGNFLFRMVDDFLPESAPYAFVLGGETTVELSSGMVGIGGRNQEAVLAASSKFKSWADKDFTIICLGTDGIDGNSKAAGALITPRILSKVARRKIEFCKYLRKHDSNTFFKKVNSTVITDATGTNVNDISIVCRLK
ncbi:MAG TPA: MOFRL family protein, partial [Nitrososphaeraceae archaeon]